MLFQPFRLGRLKLKNRIVLAPLTRSRAIGEGVPTGLHATYYAQRAGAGLLVAEATQVSPEGQGYPRTPGIYSEIQVEAWLHVTDRVHEAGSPIFLQLWHVGRIAHPANRSVDDVAVAPSAVPAEGMIYTPGGLVPFPVPRALRTDEIGRICEDYARAARNARRAGFDGVEIHAANGYLIDQFLHDGANRRRDRYGGPIENRARLLHEVAVTVGTAIGPDRVGVRLSPFGTFNGVYDTDPAALFDHVIGGLDRHGLAYLHVVNPEVSGDRSVEGLKINVAAFVRSRFSGPLITAGGYDRDSAEAVLSDGHADLVAFGRAFIGNPDLPLRLRLRASLNASDRRTFYTPGPCGYIDYSTLATQTPDSAVIRQNRMPGKAKRLPK